MVSNIANSFQAIRKIRWKVGIGKEFNEPTGWLIFLLGWQSFSSCSQIHQIWQLSKFYVINFSSLLTFINVKINFIRNKLRVLLSHIHFGSTLKTKVFEIRSEFNVIKISPKFDFMLRFSFSKLKNHSRFTIVMKQKMH